jgi:phosphoribosylformylglycinamidine synthase
MVGRLPDGRRAGRLGFVGAGDALALVGPFAPAQPASELAKLRGQALPDGLPPVDLPAAVAALAAVREGVRSGALSSAHDIAEGGIAVALAECALAGRLGATVRLGDGWWEALGAPGEGDAPNWPEGSPDAALFGEGPAGILVSGPEAGLRALAGSTHVRLLGHVGGERLRVEVDGQPLLDASVAELAEAHAGGLKGYFA